MADDGAVVLLVPEVVDGIAARLEEASGGLDAAAARAARLAMSLGGTPATAGLRETATWAADTSRALRWLVDRMVAADLGLAVRADDGHVGALVPFADVQRAHAAWEAGADAGRALRRAIAGDRDLRAALARLPGAGPMVVAGLAATIPPGMDDRLREAVDRVLPPAVEQHGNVLLDAADGAWDAVLEGVQGLGGLTVQALWDWRGTAGNWRELADGLGALGGLLQDDPVEASRVLLDRDTFNANKARWIGQTLPDVVAKVLSGGASTAATIPAMRRRLQALERALEGVDDLEGADDVLTGTRIAHRMMDAHLVREVLDQLPRGRSRSGRVRVVPTEAQLDDLFVGLLGARRTEMFSPHLRYELPDGTHIQYRTRASSWPKETIDLWFPGERRGHRIHIDPRLPPDAVDPLTILDEVPR